MARKLHQTPIAIVGMASVFPKAMNLRQFWDNIVNKADCITDVPESRWRIEDYYDPDPTAPDKTYCKRGGFLPDIDFDPMEFGLPPNILEVTDVSQMIGLVVARDALADAGYADTSVEIRDRTGVVLGVGGGQKLITPLTSRLQYPVWQRALESSGITGDDAERIMEKMRKAYIRWEENSFPGMLGNVIAGRIANRLDLGGMNCVVDAACASSMGAMKLAISDLVEGRSDMMITGGVDTDNSPFMYMCFSKTPAFTRGDNPRPFDEKSDGMMVGEGVGMMVFKRLEDAERDGDRVYAVIRGIGTSSDGRFKSIYAPRGEGQEKALDRAYEDAGVSPMTVGLFEAHGTGTVAGDQTETSTVVRFFNKQPDRKKNATVALGSIKSQIGHTKAAAGVAGMIKATLALHHKVLPATINVDMPNPKLGLDDSPIYINTQTRPWIVNNGAPRRAGVSSFGFGGTNFHFVLEEHTADHNGNYRLHHSAETVLFHAETPEQLAEKVQREIDKLQTNDPHDQFLNLAQFSRGITIPAAHPRIGFVAGDPDEALELLQAAHKFLQLKPDAEEWQHPKGIFYRRSALDLSGRVVALFSGQGSQYVEMARELALNFPEIRESYSKIDRLFKQDGLTPVSEAVFPSPAFTEEERREQAEMLMRTDYVQPAIGALSAGLFNVFKKAGFQPDFAAGHSFGELTALWAAGALNDDDYYALVKARGLAMAPPTDPNFDAGTMMAVTGNDLSNIENDLQGLEGVHLANINSPKQVVIAGKEHSLAQAKDRLTDKGYNVVPVAVSAAFHTPLVGHAQQPFAHAISQAQFKQPRVPVYSNASGQPYAEDPAAIRRTLSDHILNAVQFRKEIENIQAAGGYLFIEFGPRSVLTNLVKDILTDKPHMAIALNPSRKKGGDQQFRSALAHLRVLGLELGEIDPYNADPIKPPASGRRKGMKIQINGGMYLSDKTRKAYEDTLDDDWQISTGGVKEVIKEVPVEVIKEVEVVKEVPVTSGGQPTQPSTSLEDALALFSQQQNEILKAHQQYLANQADYIKTFTELTGQQQQAVNNGDISPQAADQLAQSLEAFHAHQAETLRVHETYLQRQSEQTQALLQTMRSGAPAPRTQPTAQPAPTPAPSPAREPEPVTRTEVSQPVETETAPAPAAPSTDTEGISVAALSSALLEIVSEKTGYPVEMLELDMDIEADLGIDSIKRVEILGAMRDQFPELPQLKAEELAELRTLQEIVDYMRDHASGGTVPTAPDGGSASTQPETVEQPEAQTQATQPAAPAPSKDTEGISVAALSSALLEIVSEKTGYPVEMLELDMDIEADLGIDSIKRVEILGAMRDQFPELPQLKAEELAELRTLQEIVDYMRDHASGGQIPTPPDDGGGAPAPATPPETEAIAATEGELAAGVVTSGEINSVLDMSVLAKALLEIVSEKTGYPVEMLELDMDIEADLGIDSIKRVEILGAMRDQFPELPQLKAEELAELRTLQEIVDYMRDHAQASGAGSDDAAPESPPQTDKVETESPPAAASATVEGISVAALSSALLEIVSEKTGYPVEMLELDMDIEADLGIDSIKRVEILGAMRDQFPELPQLKAEELAELRTLQEIVDYMRDHAGGSNGHVNGSTAPKAAAPASTNSGKATLARLEHDIPRLPAALAYVPAPDYTEITLPEGCVCLLTDDGTPLTAAVAQKLTAEDWSVVVLSFPSDVVNGQAQLPAGVARVKLSDMSENQLQAALKQISNQHGEVGAFIHLNPVTQANGSFFVAREKALLKQVFLLAKHLKAPLNEAAGQGFSAFVTVARLDGTLGTNGGDYGAIAGGLFGLVKTLNLEWSGVFCRALDIAAALDAETAAASLIDELHDPNRLLVEVGTSGDDRYTLVAAESV